MTRADVARAIFDDLRKAGLPVWKWAIWSKPFPRIGVQMTTGHEMYLRFAPTASLRDLQRFRDAAVMQFQAEWATINAKPPEGSAPTAPTRSGE